jgi:hypothetical protein
VSNLLQIYILLYYINTIYPFNIMLQILLLLAVAIQTIAAANSTISSTIVDLAVATPNLSTLVTALKAGGLEVRVRLFLELK